jgi:hypothetical protein
MFGLTLHPHPPNAALLRHPPSHWEGVMPKKLGVGGQSPTTPSFFVVFPSPNGRGAGVGVSGLPLAQARLEDAFERDAQQEKGVSGQQQKEGRLQRQVHGALPDAFC